MKEAKINTKFVAMALIVYSGGLDSTVLLHLLKSRGEADAALSVDYGQKHRKELDFARLNCQKLGVNFETADLSAIRGLFGKCSLTDGAECVPSGDYGADNMGSTVVPNRNMIMIAVAAARAIALGLREVAYAAHSGDHDIYPDCRPEFADALDAALKLCHYYPVRLLRPFVDMSKAGIVRLGADLGVDFSATWSCYNGGEMHCGKCGTCRERREAFRLAGVPDPTEYAE